MIQQKFADQVAQFVKTDDAVIGLAVGGSWLSNELDEFSDLDLILVTKQKCAGMEAMMTYARRFGNLLNAFTGEHVGEPRLLICLYDDPLLHVDIKFLTLEEFSQRVEEPVLLVDKKEQLQQVLQSSRAAFPYPDYQWIEDRFWIWIHYGLLKIGRGESFESLDFLAWMRTVVFGPLLHIKNRNLPRGVRKVEWQLPAADLERLQSTLSAYDRLSLLKAVENSILLYRHLREVLFDNKVSLQSAAEQKVMEFFGQLKKKAGS